MKGTMMDYPLTVVPILERAGRLFGKVEIVSRLPDRSLQRSTYADFHRRARALAETLVKLGHRRARHGHKSSGRNPVFFAICPSKPGPISSWS